MDVLIVEAIAVQFDRLLSSRGYSLPVCTCAPMLTFVALTAVLRPPVLVLLTARLIIRACVHPLI